MEKRYLEKNLDLTTAKSKTLMNLSGARILFFPPRYYNVQKVVQMLKATSYPMFKFYYS